MTHIDRANLIVHGLHLASLSETELKVWMVFHVHANGETGIAYPGTTLVARLIGHKDHKRARQAIDALVTKGFLTLIERATFTRPAKYRVGLPAEPAQAAPPLVVEPPPVHPTGEEEVELPPLGQIAPEVEQTGAGQDGPPTGGANWPIPRGAD